MASVTLDRGVLVSLMQEIGWKAAEKKVKDEEWTNAKIRAIPKNVAEMEFESEDVKAMAETICKAIEDDEDVEFELSSGDAVEQSEESAELDSEESAGKSAKKKGKGKGKGKKDVVTSAKEKPSKKEKSVKADKPAKAAKEKKTSTVVRDKFGSREGTRCFKINAVLGKKPKLLSTITEESGATSVSNHLVTLVKKGYITKSEKGYAIA